MYFLSASTFPEVFFYIHVNCHVHHHQTFKRRKKNLVVNNSTAEKLVRLLIISMASLEQLHLSAFIKAIHHKLRIETKLLGVDEAWENHLKDDDNLRKYALAMTALATQYWEENYKKNSKAFSRVHWIHKKIQLYFFCRDMGKYRLKEKEIALKLNIKNLEFSEFNSKLKMLDVGSCYNPFKNYNYDVTAIDLYPANIDVMKCDFLHVRLTNNDPIIKSKHIKELKLNSYDIVVFSLLLEYFPTAQQRLLCCQKAYNLLKNEGLLFIITPDSNHNTANAKIIKSWRYLLAEIGFWRIYYEKLPHIHCMALRKTCTKDIAQRWALLNQHYKIFEEIVIPQDLKK